MKFFFKINILVVFDSKGLFLSFAFGPIKKMSFLAEVVPR